MKKKWYLRSLLGVFFISIIGLITAIWLLKAPIIASYLSKKLGVSVSIGKIHLSRNSTEIFDFQIYNPPGSQTKTAFFSKHIQINYDFKELRSNPSTIQFIGIEDCFLGIELYNLTGSKNNWSTIMANVGKKKEKEKEKDVLIRRLSMTNLSVQVKGKGLLEDWKKVKEIQSITFKNINSKDGFPTDQLIREVFKEADLNKYLEEILKPENWFNKFLSPAK